MSKQAISVRISRDIYRRAEEESAELKFATAGEIINARLKTSFESDGAPLPENVIGSEREKSYKLQNEIKEWELAKLKGSLISMEDAEGRMQKGFDVIKQSIDRFWLDLPGATEAQRDWAKTSIEKLFSDIRGEADGV